MWQCDNCGYTDEDGTTFEEETEEGAGQTVRYCPECGSDEVFLVDEEDDELYAADEESEETNGEDSGEWEEEVEGRTSEEEW